MKYGLREICNVVFRAKANQKIGNKTFKKGQPVFFMDSAKTSTLESAATSVYATGGRGNTRLVTWEGEKTLTFTVEDALISPISFAMLSGAGVVKGLTDGTEMVHVHMTTTTIVDATTGEIDLTEALAQGDKICATAPLYVMAIESDGSITGDTYKFTVSGEKSLTVTDEGAKGEAVMVDYYVLKKSAKVNELQIDASSFAGNYYVEADTLFKAQGDTQNYPANITIPNVKIQSNWTFTMAATGDPSTFTFTMDAMPGYTYFDQTKKVLCVIQIIEDTTESEKTYKSVMGHAEGEKIEEAEAGADAGTEEQPTPAKKGEAAVMSEAGYTKVESGDSYNSLKSYYKYDETTDAAVEDNTITDDSTLQTAMSSYNVYSN